MQKEPLIVTVLMDQQYQDYFTNLRNQHFPKHCNYLQAHITLFHKLPSNKKIIGNMLEQASKIKPLELNISAVKNIGAGVAFEIKSPALSQLHKALQQKFNPFLISQDRNKLWPHITIQNKVTAYKAAQTAELLGKDFEPFSVKGIGIGSWLYKGGPWEKQEEYLFDQ